MTAFLLPLKNCKGGGALCPNIHTAQPGRPAPAPANFPGAVILAENCRAYQYTDESNGAITASAPFLCRDCYEQKYGVRIPTEVDAYKSRLLHTLGRYADHVGGSESDLVIRVMRLIESTD